MPADTPPPRAADARVDGPLHIVLNARAGSTDKDEAQAAAATVLTGAGRAHAFHRPKPGERLDALCERLAPAVRREGGALVAAGGDGTLNAVVNAARRHQVRTGLLPLGTFNYFARAQGIPLAVDEAAAALVDGVARPVAMGEVNGRLFFNNASFGLYTTLVRERERLKRRLGRHRVVAALSAVGALLRGQRPFTIHTVADGSVAPQYTSMVFVACNPLQLEQLGLRHAAERAPDALAVVLLRPTSWRERARLLLRTALRQLEDDGRLDTFTARSFDVHSRRGVIDVVVDGETVALPQPLRFRAVPDAVEVLMPRARA